MEPKFNINRPRVSDEEIEKNKDFNRLLQKFKQQSLQKAKHDKSWWKSKKVRYSSVIAGITVICTISYFSIFNNKKQKAPNDKITTQNTKLNERTNQEATSRNTAFVNAPSKKLSVAYSTYNINNSKGGQITHPSSSKINIPSNSFVDKNGKDVAGDVTIEYREFHDKGDVIASGIPMAYDSLGKKYNLESAGMFDIKGSQNGEPVFIKPGKDLKVELASANGENRFNQYYLDTLERNWKFIKHDKPHSKNNAGEKKDQLAAKKTANSKIEKLQSEIEIILPKKIDSVKVVYVKKAQQLPKPVEPARPSKTTGKPTFIIHSNSSEFPELAAFGNVIFEVGPENKNYTKEMHDITWTDVKISEGPQKGKNYLLTLTYHQRAEKLVVYPVLSGADFEKAEKKYEQKFEIYQGLVEKRAADEVRLKAEMEAKQKAYFAEIQKKKEELTKERSLWEAKMQAKASAEIANNFNNMNNESRATRIFEVSKFGIYNSDCAHAMPLAQRTIAPVFLLNSKPIFPHAVYLVNHTINSVYNFYPQDFSKIQYSPADNNSFVVFVHNKMYLCGKNDFKQSADGNSNKFSVTELPDNADNLIDFKKALEI